MAPHDHDHDHDNNPSQNPSVEIANQLINFANDALHHGVPPDVIAAGMRHAAANFSAFAFFRGEADDPNHVVEEFIGYLEHYLERHKPQEDPGGGILQTIAQAKKDF